MTEIYQKYFALIKKHIALKILDEEDRKDCIQECFLRLTSNVQTLLKLDSPQIMQYVTRTIRSVIIDFIQKKRLVIWDIEVDEIPDTVVSSPFELRIESNEAVNLFIQQFHTLSEVDQIIIRSLYEEEVTREQLAKKLGIQMSSIRTYISRAKKHVFALLKGGDSDR